MYVLKKLQTALTVALVAGGATALAHGGDDRRLQLIVQPGTVRLSVLISADQLMQFDRNADQQLSYNEFTTQFDQLNAYMNKKLRLTAANGLIIEPVMADLTPANHATHPIRTIRVRRTYALQDNLVHYLAVGLAPLPDHPLSYRIVTPHQQRTGIVTQHQTMLEIPQVSCAQMHPNPHR